MPSKDSFYGTGRRKTSSARVFLQPGKGSFKIKAKQKSQEKEPSAKKGSQKTAKKVWLDLKEYFTQPEQQNSVLSPLKELNLEGSFDVFADLKGGGFTGQAEALKHGLARALLQANSEHRPVLKKKGFLTRDSRMVERKKYGHHKARKSTQFSKR